MDRSGLGYQGLNLCRMLKPDKVLLVDSSPFNGNTQHPEWYEGFNVDKVMGFPDKEQMLIWLKGLTHVLSAETFYWPQMTNYALRNNIKTYVQPNWEFSDHVITPITPPTKFFMPSYWKLEEHKQKYPNTVYLPPPLFHNEFKKARETNFKRSERRFVHVVGKLASKDRNGTQSLLEALNYTKEDFELVIKSQYELDFWTNDHRVTFDIKNAEEQQDLYKDFDAMILPRRYGGLCLPANEALASGLPVIMTDILPNNRVLPKKWLVPSSVHDKLLTRMVLDVYDADPKELAKKIDWLCGTDLSNEKAEAFEISMQYSADSLKEKYLSEMK